jgi:hypothetical protein
MDGAIGFQFGFRGFTNLTIDRRALAFEHPPAASDKAFTQTPPIGP